MAKQTIDLGSAPNDGTGDPLRDALDKVNDNFDEVYSAFTFAGNNATAANNVLIGNSTVNVVANSTIVQVADASTSVNVTSSAVTVNTSTMSGTQYYVGNSTVNATMNSSTITIGAANVTSNTLTFGDSTNAANGHSVLPNGLIMQWGQVSSNSTVGDITFSTGFTDVWSITVTPETTTYDSTYNAQLIASNTTTANVRTSNGTAVTVSYLAIGNN